MSTPGFFDFLMNGCELRARLGRSYVEWYTPKEYVEAADRSWAASISIPRHAPRAEVVKATTFYTAADDGLARPWSGRIF